MSDNPLVNIGDLSKPATVLIEKIAEAVGGMFKPYQLVRVAKAEAEVEQIRAQSQIEITDIHRRAMRRFLEEEAQKQSNMEDITQRALPLLDEKASPEKIENDWITNFFDKCRIISDSDMQQLWARILAGEANSPGAFSKRTVNLLEDLDKGDAELFTRLCGFGWVIGTVAPLVFDYRGEMYKRHGINFDVLMHLESLGLVQFDPVSTVYCLLPKKVTFSYFGKPVEVTFPNDTDNQLDVGHVLLTRAGVELAAVCGAEPIEGFFEFVYDRLANGSLVPKRNNE